MNRNKVLVNCAHFKHGNVLVLKAERNAFLVQCRTGQKTGATQKKQRGTEASSCLSNDHCVLHALACRSCLGKKAKGDVLLMRHDLLQLSDVTTGDDYPFPMIENSSSNFMRDECFQSIDPACVFWQTHLKKKQD